MNPLNHFMIDTYSQNRLRTVEINRLANTVAGHLRPYASKITISGSLRRNVSTPSDIDIVLIPKDKERVKQAIQQMGGRIWSHGPQQTYFKLQGIDVNIYYANPETYGAQLLHTTGPKGSNIGRATAAKSMGLKLSRFGLFKGNKMIAGRTEREIYEGLGKKYKPPELRGI